MEISIPPGETDIVVELPYGWCEQIGPWVSLVSLILVGALALSDKRRAEQLGENDLAVPRLPAS